MQKKGSLSKKERKMWTKEEDDRLLEAVAKYVCFF